MGIFRFVLSTLFIVHTFNAVGEEPVPTGPPHGSTSHTIKDQSPVVEVLKGPAKDVLSELAKRAGIFLKVISCSSDWYHLEIGRGESPMMTIQSLMVMGDMELFKRGDTYFVCKKKAAAGSGKKQKQGQTKAEE
jgi:hypothetical protein